MQKIHLPDTASFRCKDFKFKNNLEYPVYIEGITTPEKQVTFTIYGVETRDSAREVAYESVILEKTVPDTEVINVDEGQPVGYCSVQSAHIGYKAQRMLRLPPSLHLCCSWPPLPEWHCVHLHPDWQRPPWHFWVSSYKNCC